MCFWISLLLDSDNKLPYCTGIPSLCWWLQRGEHFEDGDWPEENYPNVLLAVPNTRTAETLICYIENKKDNLFIVDGELEIKQN